MPRPWPRLRGIVAVALLPAFLPGSAHAQDLTVASTAALAHPDSAGDSIDIVPGAQYQAGGMHRMLLGNGYRDLWATPLRVPVLDLEDLRRRTRAPPGERRQPDEVARASSRPPGTEYVFRSVDKEGATFPEGFKGTVVQSIAKDQVSSHFPAGGTRDRRRCSRPAGVLHVTPTLVVMPDDPATGRVPARIRQQLGMIEEYPKCRRACAAASPARSRSSTVTRCSR